MIYLGDYAEDDIVHFQFTTSDAAGGAVAPSSAFEAADLKIYKDNVAFSPVGVTMTSPFDTTTGLHAVSLDTANEGGDAWLAGSDYTVVLSPDETVDGETVVKVIAQFSIERAGGILALVKAGTIKVDVETIKTQAVTAGAAVTINASVGAATIVPTNSQFEARSIVSENYTVVGDTIAEVTNVVNFGGTAASTQIQSDTQAVIEANHLDHLFATTYDPASKPGTADALLNELVEDDGGLSRFTENALERAPSGVGGDATEANQNTIIAVLGAKNDVTSAGDPTDAETLVQYIKQIINTLEGTIGIPALKGAAAPANDVSLSEMIRAIYDDSNDLQGNQSAWATATGFATPTNITAGTITTVSGNVNGLVSGTVAGKTPAEVADLGTVQGADNNVILSAMTDVNNRVDVGSWLGTAVTLSTGNQPDVNVDRIDDVVVSTIATAGKLHVLDDGGAGVASDSKQDTAQTDLNELTDAGTLSGVRLALMVDRNYCRFNHEVNVADVSNGSSAGDYVIRNTGDTGDIATGSITDDDTTTTQAKVIWA